MYLSRTIYDRIKLNSFRFSNFLPSYSPPCSSKKTMVLMPTSVVYKNMYYHSIEKELDRISLHLTNHYHLKMLRTSIIQFLAFLFFFMQKPIFLVQ